MCVGGGGEGGGGYKKEKPRLKKNHVIVVKVTRNKSNLSLMTIQVLYLNGGTKFLDIRSIQLGQFMYCYYLNSLLPNKFSHIFPTHSQQHSYNTRYATAFCLPQCRTNIKQFSVLYQGEYRGPGIWKLIMSRPPGHLEKKNLALSFPTALRGFKHRRFEIRRAFIDHKRPIKAIKVNYGNFENVKLCF